MGWSRAQPRGGECRQRRECEHEKERKNINSLDLGIYIQGIFMSHLNISIAEKLVLIMLKDSRHPGS